MIIISSIHSLLCREFTAFVGKMQLPASPTSVKTHDAFDKADSLSAVCTNKVFTRRSKHEANIKQTQSRCIENTRTRVQRVLQGCLMFA